MDNLFALIAMKRSSLRFTFIDSIKDTVKFFTKQSKGKAMVSTGKLIHAQLDTKDFTCRLVEIECVHEYHGTF